MFCFFIKEKKTLYRQFYFQENEEEERKMQRIYTRRISREQTVGKHGDETRTDMNRAEI